MHAGRHRTRCCRADGTKPESNRLVPSNSTHAAPHHVEGKLPLVPDLFPAGEEEDHANFPSVFSVVIIAAAVGSDRAQAEIAELLQPHPCIHLSSIDVAPGIYGEAVHRGEVSGESSATAGLC